VELEDEVGRRRQVEGGSEESVAAVDLRKVVERFGAQFQVVVEESGCLVWLKFGEQTNSRRFRPAGRRTIGGFSRQRSEVHRVRDCEPVRELIAAVGLRRRMLRFEIGRTISRLSLAIIAILVSSFELPLANVIRLMRRSRS
jgi:hypothetical protein